MFFYDIYNYVKNKIYDAYLDIYVYFVLRNMYKRENSIQLITLQSSSLK